MTVFGWKYRFTVDSSIFEYRNDKVPKEPLLDDIVAYTDYVQLRALVRESQLLGRQPVIIDIGAYHGMYAVVLGKIIQEKCGILIAVEPHPSQFQTMVENVQLNGLEKTVICEQVAIADYNGSAYLKFAGTQSVLEREKSDKNLETQVLTLTSLLEKHPVPKVDILIVDVEGAEFPVLRGFPWNKFSIPKIFCEMHPYAWKNFGYTGRDIGQFIKERSYRCFDMFLQEHIEFNEELFYIGPTMLIPA